MRHLPFIAASILAFTLAARADTIVYSYAGTNYTNVFNFPSTEPPYTKQENVTGFISFELPTPLIANQDFMSYVVTKFSFFDGVQTLNSSNATADLDFTTDALAGIRYFDIGVASKLNAEAYIDISNEPFTHRTIVQSDLDHYAYAGSGTLTVAPEPSSFVLLGTGILGVAGVLRKRFV